MQKSSYEAYFRRVLRLKEIAPYLALRFEADQPSGNPVLTKDFRG
jgi:hypothetical protein